MRSKRTLNCNNYETQISDYLEGSLSKANEDAIRFHLSGCQRCSLKVEDMKASIAALKRLQAVTPEPSFATKLNKNLRKNICHEIYNSTRWGRLSIVCAGISEFSRQRSVQIVFASSLLLTIGLTSWFGNLREFQEQTQVTPKPGIKSFLPFEPELAVPPLVIPVPLDHESLPTMTIKFNTEIEKNPRGPEDISLPVLKSQLVDVMTIRTIEPRNNNNMQTISAGIKRPIDPSIFVNYFNLESGVNKSINELLVEKYPRSSKGFRQKESRSINRLPAAIRRIRVSF